ncbi:MAG: hypothetical protein WKF87_17970 [Chryseolinea sp.]
MKIRITITFLLITAITLANDQKYLQLMLQNIEMLYKAQTISEYQQLVNTFSRIAGAEKTKWEPYYYTAFGYLMIANKETDAAKKDQWIDLAETAVKKAKEINPQESEVIALDGFTQLLRVTVDPATRGAEYSGKATALFSKAIALNPENPRPYAMLAQMQVGTAKFLNGSTAEGCATAAKAKQLFQTYRSSNPVAPVWGKEMAELPDCK